MTPEMYLMIGLTLGLASLIVTLFVVTMQMMNARFAEMNAQMIQIREEQIRLANEISELKQRMTALETLAAGLSERVTRLEIMLDRLLRLPQEPNGRRRE